MLVTVRSSSVGDPPIVQCDSEVGPITGFWRGDDMPVVGRSDQIELDADGPLAWGDGLAITKPGAPGANDQVLRGRVEDIEGDFVAVRVGSALLALTVEGEPPLGVLGREVLVRPASFSLWPTGV